MLFKRIPSFSTIIEVIIIIAIIMWIYRDPSGAGETVKGWIHFLAGIPAQLVVFFQNL